jgi:hypothetical protein
MASHSGEYCTGNCPIHPLVNDWIAEWNTALSYGESLGSIAMRYAPAETVKSAEQKEAEAKERELENLSYEMRLKAERIAIKNGLMSNKRGPVEVKKVYQPCKFLYSCVGTPAKPTTLHISSECWSHDYVCPKTGKRITKHACDRMHPGESGWCNEWETNRNFKPTPQGVETRWFALKGGAGLPQVPMKTVQQKPVAKANGYWAHLAEKEDNSAW